MDSYRQQQYFWAQTPVSGHPHIAQVDTTLDQVPGNAATKRSIQNLDQYGNVILERK